MPTRRLAGLLCFAATAAMAQPRGGAVPQGMMWLVTDREAALPVPADATGSRAVTRGPAIRYVAPQDNAVTAREPFWLRLEFQARGGSRIDPAATRVMLLRGPGLDLTQRVQPYLSATGLDIAEALAPPGRFALRVEVTDDQGRQSSATLQVNVR